MIFYGDGTTGIMWGDHGIVPFVDGKLETDDPELIEKLKNSGYRSDDDGRKAKPGHEGGQEVEKEPTFGELRAEAKEKGLKGYGAMKKAELKEALEEGD